MEFVGPGQELGKASKARARAGARGEASSPMEFLRPGQELGKASKARARAGAGGEASSPMEFLRSLTTGFRDLSFKIKSRLLPGGSSHALVNAEQLQGLMHHSLLRANQRCYWYTTGLGTITA